MLFLQCDVLNKSTVMLTKVFVYIKACSENDLLYNVAVIAN
jgi:hypothetical protein